MNKIGVTIGARTYEIQVEAVPQSDTDLRVTVDGQTMPVMVQSLSDPESLDWILVGNRSYEIVLDRDLQWIEGYGRRYGDLTVVDMESAAAHPAGREGRIKAPIPGVITRILVKVGDEVEPGQPVVVLEAMKMENEIKAKKDCVIKKVNVAELKSVEKNELLLLLE